MSLRAWDCVLLAATLVANGLISHHRWLVDDHGLDDDAYIRSVMANGLGWLMLLGAAVLAGLLVAAGPCGRSRLCMITGCVALTAGTVMAMSFI